MHEKFFEEDIQILGTDERYKIPECVNAMQNTSGGIIRIEGGGEIRVSPLEWHEKPIALDGKVWRRIEGQNVICSAWAKSIMASRTACDNFPVNASLNDKCIDEFHKIAISLHPELKNFSRNEFLKRTGIFSGKHITSAGALMFGDTLKISAVLNHKNIHAKLEARNIWEAYTNILPRITGRLSIECASAVRELIVNALLHADYNIDKRITITIASKPSRIIISNPGIFVGTLRNYRLAKLFTLSGITALNHHGLQSVIKYSPTFMLQQDMLNFRINASLMLEGISPVIL